MLTTRHIYLEFKERVELYLYYPSAFSATVLGWPLPLTYAGVMLEMKQLMCNSCKFVDYIKTVWIDGILMAWC